MRRICCLLLLLVPGFTCFAQTQSEYSPFRFTGLPEILDFSPRFEMFRPVPLASESEQNQSKVSTSAGFPQWVKDLRRGEIVFFGTLPFTVFFTRTIMGVIRMSQHDWDQRYAPWPFQSAGAVAMSNNELIWMFSIAGSASLVFSVVDHLIVRHKRKAAVVLDY